MITGQFADCQGTVYTVTLTAGEELESLEFGATPFVMRYEGTTDIFKPVRYGTATLTLLVDRIPESLYSATRQGVRCTVTTGTTTLFEGFVSPNTFNQPLPNGLTEFSIELEDCLCTLDSLEYDSKTQLASFDAIIRKAITLSGMSGTLVSARSSSDILTQLCISEQNWFDEDDEPSTYKEVLENILHYLNLTAYQSGNNLVITDIPYIKSGGFASKLLADQIFVGAPDISMGEVYNKVTLVSSLYNFDNYLPDLHDARKVRVAGYEEWFEYNPYSKQHRKYWAQKLSHSNLTIHRWIGDALGDGLNEKDITSIHAASKASWGAMFVQTSSWPGGDNDQTRRSWTEYVMICTEKQSGSNKTHLQSPTQGDRFRKFFTIKGDYINVFTGGWLCLSFEAMVSDTNVPFVPDGLTTQNSAKIGNSPGIHPYTYVAIKVGDKYYNSSTQSWQTAEYLCKVMMGNDGDVVYMNWLSEANTNVAANNTPGIEGFMIDCRNSIVFGEVSLTFCAPCAGEDDLTYNDCFAFLKNIKLQFSKPDSLSTSEGYIGMSKEDMQKSDTVWETVISELNVCKMDELELKVATDTAKGLSFASVLKNVNGVYSYLETITREGVSALPEEHLLNAYYNQYRQPRKIVDGTINELITLPNITYIYGMGQYIINSLEADVWARETTVQLYDCNTRDAPGNFITSDGLAFVSSDGLIFNAKSYD